MLIPKIVKIYQDETGHEPYIEWLDALKDKTTKSRIQQRIRRITLGNSGDHHSVGQGVSELRLDFGPGYRIYYGEQGNKIVILLCGGNKKTQARDIEKAQSYWKEYMES
ncbi:type II toxin-antitoxin system RelE/ParE family toxin [Candidatus Nucleicultrix amoebiphila]|jgi:putative addiction module killer protein|uniref:Addiction module protein n=1 Tax=Candidatus Nucleicultrix amoebiphila FS5 TaxID=1414854 RepID=A0A1W6N4Q5_9PROT|nr:type II toxin-antitoxin system RelE/ParE family toxin [Candidatus Nucleicultrix amoebiphila]ARN84834.1 hypothetical protein GQ61_05500 [Candidatus Nucleicultrix amoebiphila FS5]